MKELRIHGFSIALDSSKTDVQAVRVRTDASKEKAQDKGCKRKV